MPPATTRPRRRRRSSRLLWEHRLRWHKSHRVGLRRMRGPLRAQGVASACGYDRRGVLRKRAKRRARICARYPAATGGASADAHNARRAGASRGRAQAIKMDRTGNAQLCSAASLEHTGSSPDVSVLSNNGGWQNRGKWGNYDAVGRPTPAEKSCAVKHWPRVSIAAPDRARASESTFKDHQLCGAHVFSTPALSYFLPIRLFACPKRCAIGAALPPTARSRGFRNAARCGLPPPKPPARLPLLRRAGPAAMWPPSRAASSGATARPPRR